MLPESKVNKGYIYKNYKGYNYKYYFIAIINYIPLGLDLFEIDTQNWHSREFFNSWFSVIFADLSVYIYLTCDKFERVAGMGEGEVLTI